MRKRSEGERGDGEAVGEAEAKRRRAWRRRGGGEQGGSNGGSKAEAKRRRIGSRLTGEGEKQFVDRVFSRDNEFVRNYLLNSRCFYLPHSRCLTTTERYNLSDMIN